MSTLNRKCISFRIWLFWVSILNFRGSSWYVDNYRWYQHENLWFTQLQDELGPRNMGSCKGTGRKVIDWWKLPQKLRLTTGAQKMMLSNRNLLFSRGLSLDIQNPPNKDLVRRRCLGPLKAEPQEMFRGFIHTSSTGVWMYRPGCFGCFQLLCEFSGV